MHRYRRPRGYSLLEMVVVIAVTSALAGAVTVMLSGMLRGQSAAADNLMQVRTLSRLDAQFRRDVRAATAADLAEDAQSQTQSLTLTLPAQLTVTYIATQRRVQRVERDGDKITRREEYAWEAPTSARWNKTDTSPPAVSVTFHSTDKVSPVVAWEALGTTAVLGSDTRLGLAPAPANSSAEDAP
jgi:prepilin-type N-terminal cleavage/methylation domain-containing protein